MLLANDDVASAAARGRHVVVGVAARSIYVAYQQFSPRAAGHSRRDLTLPILPPTCGTPLPTLRTRLLSHPFLLTPGAPPLLSVATRRAENQAGASTPLLLLLLPDRVRDASLHSLLRKACNARARARTLTKIRINKTNRPTTSVSKFDSQHTSKYFFRNIHAALSMDLFTPIFFVVVYYRTPVTNSP